MPIRFSRGHAATKKLIASCAAQGVGIDSLPDAPTFRFVPAAHPERTSFSNGEKFAEPSKRGSLACGRAKPKHIKNWTPSRLDANPMYGTRMAGDDRALTDAREAYHGGNPEPLRTYLAKQAAERRADALAVAAWLAEPVQLALAA